MRRVTGVILFAVLALTFAPSAQGQPAPRRLAFAEVASTALQNNLQLRVAMLDVAVAEAQLAQARGAKNPQVSVSGSYTRSQEQAGQTLTFPNPFGPTPPEITVTLTPPDPNMLAVRLGVEFPLYTGGRLDAQIALAEANLRGARAVFARTAQLVVFSAEQTYLQILLGQENVTAAQRTLAQAEESLRVARAMAASSVPGTGRGSSVSVGSSDVASGRFSIAFSSACAFCDAVCARTSPCRAPATATSACSMSNSGAAPAWTRARATRRLSSACARVRCAAVTFS